MKKISEKLIISSVLNSDFELKIEKKKTGNKFMLTILIDIHSAFKYTP